MFKRDVNFQRWIGLNRGGHILVLQTAELNLLAVLAN